MRKIFEAILKFLGFYYYEFEEGIVYARYLEEARRDLLNCRSPLIETNDPSIM